MVVLRLKRMGRRHRAFFRLNAMEKRAPRDGRVIEELGYYDPIAPAEKQLVLKNDRIEHWLKVGAQPSDTARSLIRKAGIEIANSPKAVRAMKLAAKKAKA
jgi:small subunit ribosomal protein S16